VAAPGGAKAQLALTLASVRIGVGTDEFSRPVAEGLTGRVDVADGGFCPGCNSRGEQCGRQQRRRRPSCAQLSSS
jgi:hypothetical protein